MQVEKDEGEGVVRDPVCGRPLLAGDGDTLALVHRGRTLHFCSEDCRERFEKVAERVRVDEIIRMGALFAPGEKARWGVA